MNPSVQELGKVIEQLKSNIEYLNEHVSIANGLNHRILPLQRKIKEVNQRIKEQRSLSPRNQSYISQLCEQEYQLQVALKVTADVESKYYEALEAMSSFLQEKKVSRDLLDKYSEREVLTLAFIYALSEKDSLNSGRAYLHQLITDTEDAILITLLNTMFQLTGYKRFYIEDSRISSKYINDLKVTLLHILDKQQYKELIEIIRSKYGAEHRQLTRIDILKAIISHYNKRQV